MIKIFLYSALILSCTNPKVKSAETKVVTDTLPLVKPLVKRTLAKDFMLSVDSVVMLSHLFAYNEKTDVFTTLFKKDGTLNDTAIREHKTLSKADIITLAEILDSVDEGDNASKDCFDPHHAILAYKARKFSSLDICFRCQGIDAYEFPFERKMSDSKYDSLAGFFRKMGFKYEL